MSACAQALALVMASGVTRAQPLPLADGLNECMTLSRSHPRVAVARCESVASEARAVGELESASRALLALADAHTVLGESGEVDKALSRALDLPLEGALAARLHYDVTRRRGILAYGERRLDAALVQFRQALDQATAARDAELQAKSWNDIGNVLAADDDLRGALEAFTRSLELRGDGDEVDAAPVLNNIGDLYARLRERDKAIDYYGRAITAHLARGRTLEAAHTREHRALLLIEAGDLTQARQALLASLEVYERAPAPSAELRLMAPLADLALRAGDVEKAQALVDRGEALARRISNALPASLLLQQARLRRARGDLEGAAAVLVPVLSKSRQDVDHVELLREAADIARERGQFDTAFALLRRYHDADSARHAAEQDRALNDLRVRLEVREKDMQIQVLDREAAMRAAQLDRSRWQFRFLAASAAVLLLSILLAVIRRGNRRRVNDAVREARRVAETARYRQIADDLRRDIARLRGVLDQTEAPLMLLDANGTVMHANAAALRALRWRPEEDAEPMLWQWIAEPSMPPMQDALDRIEGGDATTELTIKVSRDADTPWHARLVPVAVDGGEVVVCLAPIAATGPGQAPGAAVVEEFLRAEQRLAQLSESLHEVDAITGHVVDRALSELTEHVTRQPGDGPPIGADIERDRDRFRTLLVELMLASLDAWQRATDKNRIELADRSRIWRVTIDDGRLRARAMERYLTLSKLPAQPRWRDVLRTAYFVLSECTLPEDERMRIEGQVRELTEMSRRRALR